MPKNTKSKKNSAKREVQGKRDLLLSEDVEGTAYGQVIRAQGDRNFMVKFLDGKERLCHLRKSQKRNFVNVEAIVLVGIRDYQDEKGDIVYVYNHEEATKLRNMSEISFNLSSVANVQDEHEEDEKEDDIAFEFDEI
jgi:translation initiation factor 1A